MDKSSHKRLVASLLDRTGIVKNARKCIRM